MGNLLSFPLLCLTNYLAFRKAVRWSEVPDSRVRINGDDIAFRSTREVANRWCDAVADSGLTLSKGKTLVHRVFFSLNSTFFRARRGAKPSLLPVIRGKTVWGPMSRDEDRKGTLCARMAGRLGIVGRGFTPCRRMILRKELLRFHRRAARALPCSLNRGLGVKVEIVVLSDLDLLDQEISHARKPARFDVPEVPWSEAVPGFHRERGKMTKEESADYSRACVQHAWRSGQWIDDEDPALSEKSRFPSWKETWRVARSNRSVCGLGVGEYELSGVGLTLALRGTALGLVLRDPGPFEPRPARQGLLTRVWGSTRAFLRAKKEHNRPVVARIRGWYNRGGEGGKKWKWVRDAPSKSYNSPVNFVRGLPAIPR